MIWTEELSASLDQSTGVVVFHHVELSRSQQLAQTLAERLGTIVEQNEKTLDGKLGNTTSWGERGAEGTKVEKRGEQTGERRRSERTRGGASTRGKSFWFGHVHWRKCLQYFLRRSRCAIFTGTWEPHAWLEYDPRSVIFLVVHIVFVLDRVIE